VKAIIIGLLICLCVQATIRRCPDLTQQTLEDTIHAASSGDTILLPAGRGVMVDSIYIKNKSLSIFGSGVGRTILKDSIQNGNSMPIFLVESGSSNFVRISGIEFLANDINAWQTNGAVSLGSSANTTSVRKVAFRVDHCAFKNNKDRGVIGAVHYGVIDHNYFSNSNIESSAKAFHAYGVNNAPDSNFNAPLAWGTPNQWYMENNYIDFSTDEDGAFDLYAGGELCYRYNTQYNGGSAGNHGYDSQVRTAKSMEIYNNKFIGTSTNTTVITDRGGACLFYNNTWEGTFSSSNAFAITYFRTKECPPGGWNGTTCDYCTGCTVPSSKYRADGNFGPDGDSVFAGNSGHATVTNGADTMVCTGKSFTLSFYNWTIKNITQGTKGRIYYSSGTKIAAMDTSDINIIWNNNDSFEITNGYPGYDQPGRLGLAWTPVYQWGNSREGVPYPSFNVYESGGVVYHDTINVNLYLQENRDFFNAQYSYTPYEYPHPLAVQCKALDTSEAVSATSFSLIDTIVRDTAKIYLQVATDTATWTTVDSTIGRSGKRDTIVASGLNPATKYYTRLIYSGLDYAVGISDTLRYGYVITSDPTWTYPKLVSLLNQSTLANIPYHR
jgi:hypothetical protein